MKIFSRAELEHAVKLDTVALGVIRNGFVALAEDRVVIPPILSMDVAENNGEVDVKTAYIEGVPQFVIKVSPGFFDNPKLGLPSLNGLMILFSSQTGLIEALLLDKGYLTGIRTALAGALAAENLANPEITLPSSAMVSGVIPASLAWCSSPRVSDWLIRSQTKQSAFLSSSGVSSFFSAWSEPIAVMCVPGRTQSASINGSRLGVVVTIKSEVSTKVFLSVCTVTGTPSTVSISFR